MSRAHHRQGSGRDRVQEIRNFDSERDSHQVLRELQKKRINTQVAIKRLELGGAYGLLSCGELLIQEAYDTPAGYDHFNTLMAAADYLQHAIRSRKMATRGQVDSVIARASNQWTNIPIHDLVIQKKFPESNLAESVHQRTIEIAHSLLVDSYLERGADRMQSVGTLGELSVLLLDQRLGVRKIGPEIYFPSPSTFKQDYRNNHGSVLDRGHDMNVYGDVGFGWKQISRVQVKTRDTKYDGSELRPVHDDISLICIDPDLRLNSDERFIPGRIIEDIVLEQNYPPDSKVHQDAAERLDARTELYLLSLGID
jgi:hypothetical protein